MWVICIGCHHAVDMKVPRKGNLRCSNCGSAVARTVRVMKKVMLNGGRSSAEDARIRVFAGLLSVAKERGYKRGWAAVKFKAVYGVWPDRLDPPPENPSGELMWWIKKQN